MQRFTLFYFAAACLLTGQMARAEVQLANVLGSNMVLQRSVSLPVWGTATAGEVVTVEFQQQHVVSTADASGRWEAHLSPLTASSAPASMTVRGKSNTVTLTNILVGEVWLVSGQSNMEFPMIGFPSYNVHLPAPIQHRLDTDLAKADCANIRLFRMELNSDQPTGKTDGWQVCNSASMTPFSAVGYYFARELREKLGVPVGILESAVGGTRIEPWTPQATTRQNHSIAPSAPKTEEAGFLFTTLIEPLVPYALRGVLWYQGEANVLAPGADTYAQKMRDLIEGWRAAWSNPGLPFEYALLAPMKYTWTTTAGPTTTEQSLPEFWAQQMNALAIPYTGMISTNDLVELSGPPPGQERQAYIMDLVHPGDKWDVAHRFALVAFAKQYGFHVIDSGPTVQRMTRHAASLQVDFEHADSGLISKDGHPLTGFEIAGPGMKFVPASARIDGRSVIVTANGVAQPAAVRFGWNEMSQPNLFNQDGLPALPFLRTLAGTH